MPSLGSAALTLFSLYFAMVAILFVWKDQRDMRRDQALLELIGELRQDLAQRHREGGSAYP